MTEPMEGYILIVLQILITGLIIWRRKQDSKSRQAVWQRVLFS